MPDTPDARLSQALAVTCDLDRDESPFGWSDLPAPPRIPREAIEGALRLDRLRRRALTGNRISRLELAAADIIGEALNWGHTLGEGAGR